MTKLDWDRVRDWDRARGDLSGMELADERDECWFERETREQERLERGRPSAERAQGPAVRTSATAPQARSAKRGRSGRPRRAGKLTVAQLASSVGVTKADLVAAQRAEAKASSGLSGMTRQARLETAA